MTKCKCNVSKDSGLEMLCSAPVLNWERNSSRLGIGGGRKLTIIKAYTIYGKYNSFNKYNDIIITIMIITLRQ